MLVLLEKSAVVALAIIVPLATIIFTISGVLTFRKPHWVRISLGKAATYTGALLVPIFFGLTILGIHSLAPPANEPYNDAARTGFALTMAYIFPIILCVSIVLLFSGRKILKKLP